MKPKIYYDGLLADMPAGADRAVLRVLSYHIGAKSAIRKETLMSECAKVGVRFGDERQARATIVRLRKAGVPICSSSGDSGYFLAGTLPEYYEFRNREYVSKIADMRETVAAMDDRAKALFVNEYRDYKRRQAEDYGQPTMI